MSRSEEEPKPTLEWPVVELSNVIVGNPKNHLAIATLWTPKEGIAQQLDPDSFAIMGQLHEKYGINSVLRNLLSNPSIRYLFVCGEDLSGSGEALVQLWHNGINKHHEISGVENAVIQQEIPRDAVERLRERVTILDLREARGGINEIVKIIKESNVNLPQLPPQGLAETYPLPEIKIAERMPTFLGVEVVKGRTVGEAWLEALKHVMRFGETVPTNYGDEAIDYTNLAVVITEENPFKPEIHPSFNFGQADVDLFINAFLASDCPPGVFYTYGQRTLEFGEHNVNQAKILIDKLKRDPHDRGAIIVLYDPWRDNQFPLETKDVPRGEFRNPCLVTVQARVVDGHLVMTSYIRSNDMFGAWPRDAFALRRYQGEIAGKLDVPLGPLVTISNSGHIRKESVPEVNKILDTYGKKTSGFEPDPRGNFVISVEGSKIRVVYQDAAGKPLRPETEWDGTSKWAIEMITGFLEKEGAVSTTEHALYLGREFVIAALAARLGIPYEQGRSNSVIDEIVRRSQEQG